MKRHLLTSSAFPIISTTGLLLLGQALEPRYPLASWVMLGVACVGLVGWLTLYGITVWRQVAHDKNALDAKHEAAMAQLFGSKTGRE